MIVCIVSFGVKNMLSSGYLRGIFGAKRCGRIMLQRYKKKSGYASIFAIKFAFPIKKLTYQNLWLISLVLEAELESARCN